MIYSDTVDGKTPAAVFIGGLSHDFDDFNGFNHPFGDAGFRVAIHSMIIIYNISIYKAILLSWCTVYSPSVYYTFIGSKLYLQSLNIRLHHTSTNVDM